MKTILSLALVCLCSVAFASGSRLIHVSIIAVTPEGYGVRCMLPFSGSDGGGKRMWEILTEPYYAESETSVKPDLNLFSLCHIKISVEGNQNPAHLKVDFTEMKIPAFIKIQKQEVVSCLLDCILDAQVSPPREKPVVTVVGKPEDKDLLNAAREHYSVAVYGKPINLETVGKKKLKPDELMERQAGNVASNEILAESENAAHEKVIVRDVRVKTPELLNVHNYRFEFYSQGFLQSCETWSETAPPAKVTITWTTDASCTVSLSDDWLQATFDRKHWSFSRRID
jgi:hypothetical protein